MTTWLRIFFIGGAVSFRALFSWIRPSVYIPTLIVGPTTQILFFAYLGRTAHLESDDWFVVGNAVQSASLAALFGMGFAIDGERWTQTLSAVLATPASRAAIFLGRAGPVLVNAAITAATGFIGGAIFLGFRMPWSSVPAILFLLLLASFACTGLGMVDRRRRAPNARRPDHRQLHDGRAVDLLWRQRPARRPTRLDERRRAVAAGHARDRGGAGDRDGRAVARPFAATWRSSSPSARATWRSASLLIRFFEREGRRRGTLDRA